MSKLFLQILLIAACGGDSSKEDGSVVSEDNCSACGADQICVVVFSDERTTRCEDIPDDCGTDASCFDDVCVEAMFDSCPDGFINAGCSDTFPPTVISCNP